MQEITLVSVSAVNEYIKTVLEQDYLLSNIWIIGEISNFKEHFSGHLYFSVKDDKGILKAVMFKSSRSSLSFTPKDGMEVMIRCKISVYEPQGSYQAYVFEMHPGKSGDLYMAFLLLKDKLEREGLFDTSKKKPIPTYPSSVGIVTSATGAAVKDILSIAKRRCKSAKIYVYDSLVQGSAAPLEIAEGIKYFNKTKNVDVIIVGRGGGSAEDLFAFNDEALARTIAGSNIPIVSAVGHETDFTIADFAADLRTPTPSAAAEIVFPLESEIKKSLSFYMETLKRNLLHTAGKKRLKLEMLSVNKVFESFISSLNQRRLDVDNNFAGIVRSFESIIIKGRSNVSLSAAALSSLSPLDVLKRGYSAALTKDNMLIKSVKDIKNNDDFTLVVTDGKITARALDIVPKEKSLNKFKL